MSNLSFLILIFIITVILRLILFRTKNTPVEFMYLKYRFNLNIKRLNTYNIKFIICILDALIVSISVYASLTITDKIIFIPIIGLVFIFALIFIINEIFGRILLIKGYDRSK